MPPIPQRNSAIAARFRDVQTELRRLRPQTAPGTLTNRTTNGVTRRARPAVRRTTGTSGPARWS